MVSVIIPTYNRANTIMASINSVLMQTYTDLELIIADDCSTDNTEALIRSIDDPRLIYFRLESNQGACAARNAGIEIAKGEIIAFHDSDDEWHIDKLQQVITVLHKQAVDVCFHKLRRHYPEEKKESFFPNLTSSKFMSHEEMCNDALISTQTIVGKREVFENHRFDVNVRKSQDYDWGIRASKDYKFYYINEILAEQYYQTDSISTKGLKVMKETRQYFLEKYANEFISNPQFELYQLLVIARTKSLLGENAKKEYERIYKIRGNRNDYVRMLLSKVGIITILYRLKGKKDRTLPVGNKS